MIFYEIRSAFDKKRDRCIYPSIAHDNHDEFTNWLLEMRVFESAINAKESLATAPAAKFRVKWVGTARQSKLGLSDWPHSVLGRPVCSKRVWSRIEPLCPGAHWVEAPADEKGARGWGVLVNLPQVNLDDPGEHSLPHLFVASNERGEGRRFVSEELKEAMQSDELIGVDFSPFETSLGKEKGGWRQFLDY